MSARGALRARNGEVIGGRFRRVLASQLGPLLRPSALQHFGQPMDDDVQEAADEQTDERRDRNSDVRVERDHCKGEQGNGSFTSDTLTRAKLVLSKAAFAPKRSGRAASFCA